MPHGYISALIENHYRFSVVIFSGFFSIRGELSKTKFMQIDALLGAWRAYSIELILRGGWIDEESK
jgi:hypothetical protein